MDKVQNKPNSSVKQFQAYNIVQDADITLCKIISANIRKDIPPTMIL
jgi:hypothetical protein